MNLITWNMQGSSHSTENKWNTGVLQFMKYAHLCCLQECGSVPKSANRVFYPIFRTDPGVEVYTWGVERVGYYIVFYPADPGGNRCNLALVLSQSSPISEVMVRYPTRRPVWRPVLGINVGGRFFFTCHAISGGGADVKGLVETVGGMPGPWVIAGDFNREPDTVRIQTGVVCPPDYFTYSTAHPDKKLDFAIKSAGPSQRGEVISSLILSDHFAVGFLW